MDAGTRRGEPQRCPAAQSRWIVRAGRLDLRATLVPGGADDLLEEGIGHSLGIVVWIDDQKVDGPDEATGPHRRPERQDGASDDGTLGLSDEDACLRQVDELTEQVRGIERTRVTVVGQVSAAEGDETIDIRDTGGSDQVFHAEGSYLAGRRPSPLDRGGTDPWSGPIASDPVARE